jgi:hypothetical protein
MEPSLNVATFWTGRDYTLSRRRQLLPKVRRRKIHSSKDSSAFS